MRVGMADAAAGEEIARSGQRVDDGGVGVAFLAVGLEDGLAAEEGEALAEGAVLLDVVGDDLGQHAGVAVELELLHPVRGGAVDEAGALVVGDEGGVAEVAGGVPFAVGAFDAGEGVGEGKRCQFGGRDVAQAAIHGVVEPRGGHHAGGELVGEKVAVADPGPALLGPAGDLVEAVGDVVAVDDAAVRGDRPGGGGPDHHRGAREVAVGGHHRELHPDGEAVLVVVFDFGLGERGLLHGAPHHRFRAAVERAVHQEGLEFLGDHPLGVEVHGDVGVGPVAGDAEALELLALDVDPALGELAAFLAEGDDVDLVLVEALRAILLLDLPLDRQAVAVPAGDVAGVAAHHLLRADHHVLQDLVERVADMEMPVGIGRPVMQRERHPAGGGFAQAVVDADPGPALQPGGFPRGQARAHREIGLGQVQRRFVVGRLGGGFGGTIVRHRASSDGWWTGAAASGRGARTRRRGSGRRAANSRIGCVHHHDRQAYRRQDRGRQYVRGAAGRGGARRRAGAG